MSRVLGVGQALWLCIVLGQLSFELQAAETEPHRCAPNGVALGGYDPISYRQDGGPKLGSQAHRVEHGGLTYRFLSPENQAEFLRDPERYLPRYRGWCATNLAFGRLACPEYTNFKIENGDLLLFEHHGFTNGRSVWNSNPRKHQRLADQQFAELIE